MQMVDGHVRTSSGSAEVTIGMKSTQVLGAGAAWQNQAARRNRLRRLMDPFCRSSVKIEDITMASSNYIDNDEIKIFMD